MIKADPKWYIFLNDSKIGPLTLEEIKKQIDQKVVLGKTPIFTHELGRWLFSNQVPEIEAFLPVSEKDYFNVFFMRVKRLANWINIEARKLIGNFLPFCSLVLHKFKNFSSIQRILIYVFVFFVFIAGVFLKPVLFPSYTPKIFMQNFIDFTDNINQKNGGEFSKLKKYAESELSKIKWFPAIDVPEKIKLNLVVPLKFTTYGIGSVPEKFQNPGKNNYAFFLEGDFNFKDKSGYDEFLRLKAVFYPYDDLTKPSWNVIVSADTGNNPLKVKGKFKFYFYGDDGFLAFSRLDQNYYVNLE